MPNRCMIARLATSLALATLLTSTATGQTPLFEFEGYSPADYFGWDVAGGLDVDRDGVPDVIAGGYRGEGLRGHLKVVSGADGSVIHEVTGDPNTGLGAAVSLVGDLDADGHAEFAGLGLFGGGWVFSGATGQLLFELPGASGRSLDRIADVNSDDVPDIMVSTKVHSGATGEILTQGPALSYTTLVGDTNGDGASEYVTFAHSGFQVRSSIDHEVLFQTDSSAQWVAGAGDVDADGNDDWIAVGYAGVGHEARVWSGATGTLLRVHEQDFALDGAPMVGAAGDIDGDGYGDYTVRSRVFSGRTGCLLMDYHPGYAFSVATAGDVDGDGRDEVIVGDAPSGRAYVYSYDGSVGLNYCAGTATSTGRPSIVGTYGSSSVLANDLTLTASDIAPGQAGLFFYGAAQIQVPFGNGFRCVEGGAAGLARLPVRFADANGCLMHALDNSLPPSPGNQIVAGSTWNFQAWFRDPAAGGAAFNLSDAVSVSFQL